MVYKQLNAIEVGFIRSLSLGDLKMTTVTR